MPSGSTPDTGGSRRPAWPGRIRSPLPWLGALLALYLVLPLAALAEQLVKDHGAGLGAPGLGAALSESLLTATCTAAVCALLGVPLAYSLAHSRGRIAKVVGGAVLLPLALPPLMAGILLVSVVGPDTALGGLFGGRLTDSMAGIVLAQTFVAAPFTIVAARSAFAAVDPSLVEVVATLGLGGGRRFFQVSVPVAARGIGAGLLLTWLRAFGEFGATVVVAYHPYSLPVFTYVRFGGFGLPEATAPTVLALVVAFVVLTLARVRLPRRPTRPTPRASAPSQGAPAGELCFCLDAHVGTFHLHVAHRADRRQLAILGPSGAGKTTILRALAGLAGPHVGSVHMGTTLLSDLPAEQRRVGYVPQDPSLVPQRSVWHQVTLGADVSPGIVAYWIERLGLRGLEDRGPDELSGGQRHRVALARALARAPRLLLLDEPFAGLDAPLRSQLQRELRQLLNEDSLVSVLVTHDPEEAALLAQEILVIDDGRLLQAGAVTQVLAHPASPAVARILGIANLHQGLVSGDGQIDTDGALLRPSGASLPRPGTQIWWGIRPEHVAVSFDAHRHLPHDAVVVDSADLGTVSELRVSMGGSLELIVRLPPLALPPTGASCTIELPDEHLRTWPAAIDERLLVASAQA